MKNKPLIIFGTGQQSDIISFYLKKLSKKVEAYCVDEKFFKKSNFNKTKVITTSELIKKFKPKDYNLHVALSYKKLNTLRSDKFFFFKKKGYYLESITNNLKIFNSKFKAGENSVILDTHIQPKAKIGYNTFIWSGSIIGHNSKIGNHCWISSGSVIGGNCKLKDYSFFGMNSTIGHFVKIGKKCFIGSSSHITKKVNPKTVVIQPDSKQLHFDPEKFLQMTSFK